MACSYCPEVTAANGLVVYVVIDAISLINNCEKDSDKIETRRRKGVLSSYYFYETLSMIGGEEN